MQRKLLVACLEAAGIEGQVTGTAAETLWLFERRTFDLVSLDIDLHAAEGIAAFEAIAAAQARSRAVPVLAITANECGWSEADYRDAGFAGLFLKPIEPFRLYHAIDVLLRQTGQPPLLVWDEARDAHVA